MHPILEKLNLARPTIARDLSVTLVMTIFLVFGGVGAVNYVYSVERDSKALNEKANEIMDNLASVLATPLWNLNADELRKIIDVYRQSGIVLDIRLVDETGGELVPALGRGSRAYLEMTRVIRHEREPIGRLTVSFSDQAIVDKQREIAVYSLIVFALLTVALTAATTALLSRFLKEPLNRLKQGLDVISSGDYSHVFPPVRQTDINEISAKVMGMADEIAHRESALEENRAKLEILNQAILDIFSCSDTPGLIRTTMLLAHKVCGVDQGWFLAKRDTSAEGAEETSVLPPPLIAVRGHTFEASEKEVASQISLPDTDKRFTFVIKSRYRTIGSMTLAFDESPDPSITSLLKSLMSLATLAMVRQSFIRETAFISAELTVAEAVQRSMLLENSKAPLHAIVSYHYEPVLRVGGDWFSVIESKDGDGLFVLLGDVTGHGLAQGLMTTAMAGALSIIEAMIREFGASALSRPSEIITQLNAIVTRLAGKSNLRMTCVAAHIDFREMRLRVCNAGHTFPLVVHQPAGTKVKVESLAKNQQPMLGDDHPDKERGTFTDAEYDIRDDDLLVFYTDGLTEAVDKQGKSFFRSFHRHIARSEQARSVAEMRDDILSLFRRHTAGQPVKDDICLLVVGKKPKATSQVA